MNRAEKFKNGEFYKSFNNLKSKLAKFEDVKVPNQQVLHEFNRFKKVIKYMDGHIELVDWDLLTTDEINSLNSQTHVPYVQGMHDELDHIKSFIEDGFNQDVLQHTENLNSHLDRCLDVIKTIFPKFILPKKSIKNVFDEYSKTIQEHLELIDFDT